MKYSKQLLSLVAMLSLTLPAAGYTADGDVANETPSYTNAAQAMHASNLADAAARNPDPATEAAAEDLHDARQEYDRVNTDPDATVEEKELAYTNLESARENYAGEIERLTGMASEEIYSMRDDGMGWGQIAHELGVHPGTLGLGHTKKNRLDPAANDEGDFQMSENEIAKATKRDTKQGWSKNHAVTTSNTKNNKKTAGFSGSQSNSSGKSANKNSSSSKNNSGKSNNGKGQSSKGNNGKGNSKNK